MSSVPPCPRRRRMATNRLYPLFVLVATTATTVVLLLLAAAPPLAMAVTFQGQDYPYEEPETDAVRSPCPALNTLANHGLIPRNGKNISVDDLALVASNIYSLSEQSVQSMVNAHIQRGMAHRLAPNADGSTLILFDLSDAQVLDHDASFTWLDEEFRNGVDDVNTCLVDSLMRFGYNFVNRDDDDSLENNTSIILTPTSVERFLRMRYQDSKRYNPNFEFDDASLEILATQASQLFAVSDHPDLEAIDRSVLYEWLKDNRLSDNYVPRSTSYAFVGADDGANVMRNDASALLHDQFQTFLRTVVQEEITDAPAETPGRPMCVEEGPTSAPVLGGDDGDSPTLASATQATLPAPTSASMKPTMPFAAVSCSADGTDASKEPLTTVRIATWAQVAPSLQAYVDAYHASISSSSSSSSTSPRVQLQVFPSIRDLGAEVLVDLQFQSQLYDGFVVPPFFMGDLFAKQGLLKLDNFLGLSPEDNDDAAAAATVVDEGEQKSSNTATVEAWKDILPLYRNTLATFGGDVVELSKEESNEKDQIEDSDNVALVNRVRMIPLLGGNQLTMWYRKDWLELYDLQPPRTWADYVRVANVLHNKTLGPNGESIVGSCLGRQSLETCRRAMNAGADGTTAGLCRSLSMSYLGMMMASMTQINDSSTGWAFYEQTQKDVSDDAATFRRARATLKPLLRTVLETTLYLMEQQLRYGASQEMAHDTSLNAEMFRNGTCAVTISAQPPQGLVSSLNQGKVGVAPLPGAYQVLKDRGLAASSKGDSAASFEDCTTQTCPYGVKDEDYGIINRVPFGGITDVAMGGISSQVNPHSQHAVKDFFQFVLTHPSVLAGAQQEEYQPLRYSQLADVSLSSTKNATSDPLDETASDEILMAEYNALILSLTTGEASKNAAIPLRIPNAFAMWSELDNRVHEYLSSNNFTDANRRQVRIDVEKHWNYIVDVHDSLPGAVPMSTFYEKSLGTYKLTKPKDAYIGATLLYIGWACGALCLLSSMASALWVKYYIKERVVIASQPMFLWTICAGTFIMGLSIFPFGIEDDMTSSFEFASASCMGAVWLYAIGFCLLFAALYSKMGRINTTYRLAYNFQRIDIEPKDILMPLVVTLPLNMLVILIWNILDPMRWKRFPLGAGLEDRFDTARIMRRVINDDEFVSLELSEPNTFGTCTADAAIWYFGALFTIDAFMSMYALIQAYEIRKVSTEYNESVWIGAILASLLQSWVMGLAVLTLLDDNPKTKFFVKTAVVFSSVMVTLTLTFVPKFGYLRKSKAADQAAWDKAASAASYQQKLAKQKEQDMNWGRSPEEASLNQKQDPLEIAKQGEPVIEQASPGIRITQSRSRRSAEVQRMKEQVAVADEKNRILFERLERLQDRLASLHFDSQMAASNAPSIHEYNNSFRGQ